MTAHRQKHADYFRTSRYIMEMFTDSELKIDDIQISGHAQSITLRSYRTLGWTQALPLVLYFHGGSFTSGSLEEADSAGILIARQTPAWVVSVGYSLAPAFPFPHAPEDGYLALQWACANARKFGADSHRIGIAGHDAGGSLATAVAAIARDRSDIRLRAQVLLAPLLDPSMTCIAADSDQTSQFDFRVCASCYSAYLPTTLQRLHPYAAPLESRRLFGLPPALIASVEHDEHHIEAERYASALIAAGVPTEVTRYEGTSHAALAQNHQVIADVTAYLSKRLVK